MNYDSPQVCFTSLFRNDFKLKVTSAFVIYENTPLRQWLWMMYFNSPQEPSTISYKDLFRLEFNCKGFGFTFPFEALHCFLVNFNPLGINDGSFLHLTRIFNTSSTYVNIEIIFNIYCLSND